MTWTSPSIRRYYIDEFCERHASALAAGRLVLDLGGKKTGKRGAFDSARYARRVIYVNLTATSQPDVCADGGALPLRAGSCDVVLCTEVLEHVEDPSRVLREVHRVLGANGSMILSAPFLYPVHEDPVDYARYTPQFWRSALDAAGFRLVALEPQGGLWSVLVDLVRVGTLGVARGPGAPVRMLRRVMDGLLGLGSRLAVRREAHAAAASVTTGYGLVAVKI
jgi:SAM-dependent methyltransferase